MVAHYTIGITEVSTIHLIEYKSLPLDYSSLIQVEKSASQFSTDNEFSCQPDTCSCTYSFPVFDTVSDYVYHSFQHSQKNGLPFDEIRNNLVLDPSIIQGILANPLVQNILSDFKVSRHLILSNPIVTRYIDTHPEFEQYLQKDSNIAEIIDLLSNPDSYYDFKYTRQVLIDMVEDRTGKPFQLFQHVNDFFLVICRWKSI